MPWKKETLMSLKEEFAQRALANQLPFSQLCLEYNITRKTGYLWVDRYKNEGRKGLIPRSKKPLTSPAKTPAKIEDAIITLRLKQPTWGARKIIQFLTNQNIKNLPAPSTVTAILERHHLIPMAESLKRKKLMRFEREFPNDLWQIDFKGKFQLLSQYSCHPLTILDDHSRFSLNIKACRNEQCLTVKNSLIYIFKKYGLPHQINVDNGNPWGHSKLIPYTTLTVWLMQLGIRVTHSRPYHPQTNGKCERFHRTLKNDLISRVPMRSFSHAQKLFDAWRKHYNHQRPHEAINMNVPAALYCSSSKMMPARLPSIEYNENAVLRKVRDNGYISYHGKEFLVGEAFKNNHIQIKYDELDKTIALYFGAFKIYTYEHID